jgi:UDP-N-acetylmuramoylalanine--D-glutamate ligase
MNSLMESLQAKFRGKKVLVVGLGLQGGGVGVARFFAELGARVTATDLKIEEQLKKSLEKLKSVPIRFVLGKHDLHDFISADYIFKGPAVRWDLPEIIAAQKKGIPIEMEASFFASLCPAKIIGITGTRGKSTVTMMLYGLLKNNGESVYLGGNISDYSTIEILKTATEKDLIVLELSSWQLSGFHKKKISPHIAVFTNLYPDHLNYYKTMDEYWYDKSAIFIYQKQGDYLVANEMLRKKIVRVLTAKTQQNIKYYQPSDFPQPLRYLKGEHNKENASAVLHVANILGVDEKKAIDFITQFKNLSYRQEIIAEKNKAIFINDTTSTTPVATIKAIDSFSDARIILILGGNAKNLPTDELMNKLKSVEKIILLAGSFTDLIKPELYKNYADKIVGSYDDLEEAIKKAYKTAQQFKKQNIYILFSPGATSFAMFNNEFHRGEEFNKIVKKL